MIDISSDVGTSINESAGVNLSLECSVAISPTPTPPHLPRLQWMYMALSGSLNSLPDGVEQSSTIYNGSRRVYTSTLMFMPLQDPSHAGNYTCQLEESSVQPSSIAISTCKR